MPSDVKQVLIRYLNKNTRLEYELRLLPQLFQLHKNGARQISKRLRQTSNPLKILKLLILVQQCYGHGVLDAGDVSQLVGAVRPVAKGKEYLQQMLCGKVIPQYGLYLQKRYQTQQQDQHHNPEPLPTLFIKINLLKLSLEFADILYTFGRYFPKAYPFVIDFNIVLAKDIRQIYAEIAGLVDGNRSLLEQGIKEQIEILHERMYIVYYNCYYYTHVRPYLPQSWLDLHSNPSPSPAQLASKQRSEKSTQKSQRSSQKTMESEKTILSIKEIERIREICKKGEGVLVGEFQLGGGVQGVGLGIEMEKQNGEEENGEQEEEQQLEESVDVSVEIGEVVVGQFSYQGNTQQ